MIDNIEQGFEKGTQKIKTSYTLISAQAMPLTTVEFYIVHVHTASNQPEEVRHPCAFTSLFLHSTPTLPYKFVH